MTNACYEFLKNSFPATAANAAGIIRSVDNMQDKQPVQGGIRYHFIFNNAVVIPDRFNTANNVHLLNSKYLYPVFHEADYFTVDPFIKPSNQRLLVTTIYIPCPSIFRS